MNLFFDGMKMRNVSPSLVMSKTFFATTGAWPIMRMCAGFCARMNPRTSWYSSITPL